MFLQPSVILDIAVPPLLTHVPLHMACDAHFLKLVAVASFLTLPTCFC